MHNFRIIARLGSLSLITLAFVSSAYAGSATWSASPPTNDWNTASNWTPNTVPNGTSDQATFSFSNTTSVSVSQPTKINTILFDTGANAYTISDNSVTAMEVSGSGISNNSGIVQNFQINTGAQITLLNSASLGSSTMVNIVATQTLGGSPGHLLLNNTATADHATILAGAGGSSATAAATFFGSSTAGNAIIISQGGFSATRYIGGTTSFEHLATAPAATITAEGASVVPSVPGAAYFFDSSNAGTAVITATGGTVTGARGGFVQFFSNLTANSTLIADAGTNGGGGGTIVVDGAGAGAQPRVELFGNGNFNIIAAATIGSVEGDGLLYLGGAALTVGANGLSTLFSGVIQDGGFSMLTGGSLIKSGSGTFTLTGANTYTGSTTVNAGTLVLANQTGSGTGTTAVSVAAGTIGGSGTVSGPVTVGTGSGSGAFLAPAAGSKTQATFTTQGALTLQADATYTWTIASKGHKVRSDRVVANGVTIQSGAKFTIVSKVRGALPQGTILTVINNTSATPIAGTFTNLADGTTLTIGSNHLMVSYEGGTDNDLTLTVVP